MNWKLILDYVCGITLFLYVMATAFFGILVLAITDVSVPIRILVFSPAFLSIGYLVWRIIGKSR